MRRGGSQTRPRKSDRAAQFSSRRLRRQLPRIHMRTLAKGLLPNARLPTTLPRRTRQPPGRIHRNRMSNGVEHAQIGETISVGITARKINPVPRSKLRNRSQFRAAAHVLAANTPIPDSRTTRRDFQLRRTYLDLRGNQRGKPPRHDPRQRRQSPGHDKQTMTLRAVPHNPLQPLFKEGQRVPAKKLQPKRLFPLVHQRFANSAEITLVPLRSTVQIVPESSRKSRQPPSHLPAGNLIALQQIADEPPLQRRRSEQRPVQIKKHAHRFRTSLPRDHRRTPSTAASARIGSFRSTAARSR